MKVVLNLEAAGWLGGRYYLQNLALSLQSLPARERPEVLVLASRERGREFANVGPLIETVPRDAVVFPNWGLDQSNVVCGVHWIPDLQHRILPRNFGRLARLRRDRGYKRLGAAAKLVVVSSEAVRHDVAHAYPQLRDKLRVVNFTTVVQADAFLPGARQSLARYALPDTFVLLANQFWAHKNHETALAAASQFGVPLVCTGTLADDRDSNYVQRLTRMVERVRSDADIRILGVVERYDYLQLIRAARVILQPSLFEGWSSIVEDARAFGKPVALSSIPVHHEQNPNLGFYFEPLSPSSLAKAVLNAMDAAPLPEHIAFAQQTDRVLLYARRFIEVAAEAKALLAET